MHKRMQHSHIFTLSRHALYVFPSVSLLFYTSLMQPFLLSQHFFIMALFQGVAMSPENLSEASSSVFVAVTFALLRFCISGTFGFAMQCVLIFRARRLQLDTRKYYRLTMNLYYICNKRYFKLESVESVKCIKKRLIFL